MPPCLNLAVPTNRLSPTFWRFWLAGALSNLGDGVRLTALPLLVATLTRDPFPVSVVMALTMLPWLLFGVVGGTLVDRLDRRQIIIIGQVGRGVAVAVLAVVTASGHQSLALIYAVAFLIGLGEVFVDSAMQAAIPQLATDEQLERANARMIVAEVTTNEVVGAPLGAALFVAAAWIPFGFDSASFVLGALLVATLGVRLQGDRATTERAGIRQEIADGLRFVRDHPLLRGLAVSVACFNAGMSAAASVLVLYALDELHASERAYGWFIGLSALGGVLGALVASAAAVRLGRRAVMIVSTAVAAVCFGLLGLAEHIVLATVLFFLAGVAGSMYNVVGRSVRQSVTPDRLLGRVIASMRLLGLGAVSVGALLGGGIATWWGVRAVFAFAVVLGCGAAVLLLGATRHLEPV